MTPRYVKWVAKKAHPCLFLSWLRQGSEDVKLAPMTEPITLESSCMAVELCSDHSHGIGNQGNDELEAGEWGQYTKGGRRNDGMKLHRMASR